VLPSFLLPSSAISTRQVAVSEGACDVLSREVTGYAEQLHVLHQLASIILPLLGSSLCN
jgi:hypothetical protein